MIDPMLKLIVRILNTLSPRDQELVAILVRQLAKREGIDVPIASAPGLQTPAEGIPIWVAKLKHEGYSRRTIELYLLTVQSYLKHDPVTTKLSLQSWLAERLESVSTAMVSNDRKALKSLFGFLYREGLWANDPTSGLNPVKVRYRARELPDTDDVRKLISYKCYRPNDTLKFQMILLLLITTGLRLSEAAGILKNNINLDTNEIKVIGKGGKVGVVPLLPITTGALAGYIKQQDDGSPYLFPGNTELGYWSISSFEKTLRRACEKLGIREITHHQLRHYFATYALKGRARLEVVSKIFRHASVAITTDIYRHVVIDEMHDTVRRFAPFSQDTIALPGGSGSESATAGEDILVQNYKGVP